MDIIPAIDLKSGKCVRLLQGKDDATTEYSNDPVAVAKEWVKQGATRLHLVNLDGAFGRASDNLAIVRKISGDVDAAIQFGGGLRSWQDIEQAFEAGVKKVVMGTAALEDSSLLNKVMEKYGSASVIVALDANNGKVATHGWQSVTTTNILDAAALMRDAGVREILYTDIQRDGMMNGPDYDGLKQLASLGVNVIASGGISSLADVLRLLDLRCPGITGVIIGKALYERRILLPELFDEVRRTQRVE